MCDRLVVVVILTSSSQTSYPATPTLSVAAFHAIAIVDCVVPVIRCPCGTDGGCVSGQAVVETITTVGAERLPATSAASTASV